MKYYITILFVTITLFVLSCNKQDQFLGVKPNLSDVTPVKLEDFQALLDNDGVMNSKYGGIPTIGSDNIYLPFTTWQSGSSAQERNSYIWKAEIYEGESGSDWRASYQIIEYANIVLKGLGKIKPVPSNLLSWNNVKGSALFFRAYSYYNLAQTFATPYSASLASSDLGIPIRLSDDINEVSKRASLQETYDWVIKDLEEAADLLPVTPLMRTRPSKPAAYGLLARVNLAMGNYEKALFYANSSLSDFNSLIDYNSLDTNAHYPFPMFNSGNKEIIFYSLNISFSLTSSSTLRVDTLLYSSYEEYDLRKKLFFNEKGINDISFGGNYSGLPSPFFAGLACNEIYLIKAECNARLGKTMDAMNDLNALLSKRWITGTFIPYAAIESEDALKKIIYERRKELPFTGSLRWQDLRRLNKDPRFAKELTRNLNGQTYRLPPNDKRYTYPIPDDEIRLSGIQQNPR